MPDILIDRDGWDFFECSGSTNLDEHIERIDEQDLFEDDLEAETYVLFHTLAALEQWLTDCLELDYQCRDTDGYRCDTALFARRVLAAVARVHTRWAESAAQGIQANAFLVRLRSDPDWRIQPSLELISAQEGDSEPIEEDDTNDGR